MQSEHLVLLHGQPGAGSDWGSVVDWLPAHLRPLVLDRPGYQSNPNPAGDFKANAVAILAELDTAGIDKANFVGHSYGGGVAIAVALLAPERVGRLVLVSSIGPGCLNNWDKLLAAPIAGPVCAVAAWSLSPWFARAWLARIERLRNRPLEHEEFVNWDIWAQAHHEHGAVWRTFLTEQRALVKGLDDLVDSIPQVRAPTLVLADPNDTVIPLSTARALCELLVDARLQLIPEGGHHLPRRTAQAVAEAIGAFLAG
jgi:pimeloyl-ACP methyl ester carboxylesterase